MESWKLDLHPEDIDLAERVWDAYCLNNDLRAILFAPTQSGKTFKNIAIYKKFEYEIRNREGKSTCLFLFGPPNTALRDQNIERFQEFGVPVYPSEHYITWGADKRNGKIATNISRARKNGQFILFLQDEADEGTGDEQIDSKLREFFKKHNVPFGDIISNRKGKEFAALTTATPAHYIEPYRSAQNKKNSNVKVFHCKPGANYSSILGLYNSGQILDVKGYDQPFEICDCIENMISRKNMGYIVVRSSKNKQSDLEGDVNKLLGTSSGLVSGVDYQYERYEDLLKNIKQLKSKLKNPPTIPTIIFIKRAAGRGVTIPTNHIIQWWDNCSHEAATIQSNGRFSGYDKNNRSDLIIYTNISHLENNLDLYSMAENGADDAEIHDYLMQDAVYQSGTHLKGYKNQRRYSRVCEHQTSAASFHNDFQNLTNGNILFRVEKGISVPFVNTPSVTKCSNNQRNSIPAFFLKDKNGEYRRQVSPDSVVFCNPPSFGTDLVSGLTKAYSIIDLDSPNPNYVNEWNQLSPSQHGYWIIEACYEERFSSNTSGYTFS